jgi:hypothetical protein
MFHWGCARAHHSKGVVRSDHHWHEAGGSPAMFTQRVRMSSWTWAASLTKRPRGWLGSFLLEELATEPEIPARSPLKGAANGETRLRLVSLQGLPRDRRSTGERRTVTPLASRRVERRAVVSRSHDERHRHSSVRVSTTPTEPRRSRLSCLAPGRSAPWPQWPCRPLHRCSRARVTRVSPP